MVVDVVMVGAGMVAVGMANLLSMSPQGPSLGSGAGFTIPRALQAVSG
jgi:hypothetical protein